MILRVKAVQKVCPKSQGCPKEVLLPTSSLLPQTPSPILSTSSHPRLTGNNLFFLKNYLFIYLWLCWVFVSVRGPSPAAASRGHSSSRCAGLSLPQPLPLRSTGSRRAGSAIVARGPSRSAARGIFPDQGSNPCPLHWQADSQPLRHQGSPQVTILLVPGLSFLYFFCTEACMFSRTLLSYRKGSILYTFFCTWLLFHLAIYPGDYS